MQNKILGTARVILLLLLFSGIINCQKNISGDDQSAIAISKAKSFSGALNAETPASPPFNLEVILRGEGKSFGHVKFRQDNDAAKIVTLDTWVRDLEPNHEYNLQRAVDTNIDGNCTSTTWLTLGKGLTPQSITTDDTGTGREELWRSLSAFPSGATFDIHFQVIDAATSAVVLTSDCYKFIVR